METKLLEIKAAIAVILSTMGIFLGWKGVVVVVWLCAMILDYLSGTFAAMKAGEWSSAVARDGIYHKCGMILVVIVAIIADAVISTVIPNLPIISAWQWPALVYPTVLVWYIFTELGSVLENAVKMGAPVPEALVKLLKVGFEAVNKASSESVKKNE